MQEINTISRDLYDKLVGRFPGVVLGDESAETTTEPEQARFYSFKYRELDRELGSVTVSIIDPENLKIVYSRGITDGAEDINAWFKFLRGMRKFAVRHMMGFEVQDITKPELDQQDYAGLQRDKKTVEESRMWGSRKTSYQKMPAVKLIVRHSSAVDETVRGARSRRISRIFAETSVGERFLLPTQRLSVARALAQHISAGGRPWDELAETILAASTVRELKKVIVGAKTRSGYERLKKTLSEIKDMDLQLTEDQAQDQLTVNAEYASELDLVEAVMQVIASRTQNPLVKNFAESYSGAEEQQRAAVQLATQYLRTVRESMAPATEIAESDDRVVGALRQLALDMGGMDRSDVKMVADMIADNTDSALVRQYILDLDTAPREAILDVIQSFEPGMLKAMFPRDAEREQYLATMREDELSEDKTIQVELSNIEWVAEPGMTIPSTMTISVNVPSGADEDDVYELIASTLEDEVGYSVRDFDYKLEEGYRILPNYDTERYGERPGLEGPMRARNGKVVYYDTAEGRYYDPDTDMYIDNDEWDRMNENVGAPQTAAHRRAQLPKKVKLKGFGPDGAKGNMGNPAARGALKAKQDDELSEAVTTAVAWPAQEYFDMSDEERREIGDCFKPYKDKVQSTFEKKNGKLYVVVDGDAKVMATCQKDMKQKGIKFMATEAMEIQPIDHSGDDDEYNGASAEDIASAITSRLFNTNQMGKLLQRYDIIDIQDAIDDAAQFHAGGDMGTSDVSAYTQMALDTLSKGRPLPEDYNPELSAMANSRDKVERAYGEIIKADAEESEVGDYISRGMTKDQILKLIDMLEPQGYDKDFLLKDLAPMMEAELEEDNAFNTAAAEAALAGKKEFEFDGKTYPVKMSKEQAQKLVDDINENKDDYDDAQMIADENGVQLYTFDVDSDGSAIEVHVNGEKAADGYVDILAGDIVVDGKSFPNKDAVISYYSIPDMGEQDLNDIKRLAGLEK